MTAKAMTLGRIVRLRRFVVIVLLGSVALSVICSAVILSLGRQPDWITGVMMFMMLLSAYQQLRETQALKARHGEDYTFPNAKPSRQTRVVILVLGSAVALIALGFWAMPRLAHPLLLMRSAELVIVFFIGAIMLFKLFRKQPASGGPS
ncbi:MAG: hypothetical protein JSR45_06940 [Proteobacteria bacterium]|nr:hypothetical protein [Pseudomonadota bacterium]